MDPVEEPDPAQATHCDQGFSGNHDPPRRTDRLFFQPGGDVDRVSDHGVIEASLQGTHPAGNNHSRVDPDPVLDRKQALGLAVAVESGKCPSHFDRRPSGPERVVLGIWEISEDSHHRIADQFVDAALMQLHRFFHAGEVLVEKRDELFR